MKVNIHSATYSMWSNTKVVGYDEAARVVRTDSYGVPESVPLTKVRMIPEANVASNLFDRGQLVLYSAVTFLLGTAAGVVIMKLLAR